ncbi:hypothetical protein PYW08_012684 [Mythimna loreyi]|uniref:Uncharacterized protein n=1 Tax=Mythimna loreyi TaxID=667449 RepID=A0ACC2Q5W3_9NEOP|nr:hypothetical protein PYW08_012684 [Mythimna loreyi]
MYSYVKNIKKYFYRCLAHLINETNITIITCAFNIETNIKKNPKQFWQHITSLRCKGGFQSTITHHGNALSGVDAANAFAEYFSSVFLPDFPELNANKINNRDTTSNSNYINIAQISSEDVERSINKLRLSSSAGPDNIPSSMLKLFKKYLSGPLCRIYNLALRTGKYPSKWKISWVTPIPKKGAKASVEDFRPFAILSSPAKVFEHILHKEILRQVNKYPCNEQHGFRVKRSVNTNLVTLADYIATSMDLGRQVDVLYFDFQKAFDRINNDILLEKLSAIGFAPNLLILIADYLRDRQQYVRLGMYNSQPYNTRSGVSQGSILGPLLFLIMINDIPQVLNHSKCLLYADDLKLYSEVQTLADCAALQKDIDAISEWSVINKMNFNPSKCCIMSFSRSRNPIQFTYIINDVEIPRVMAIKDLGVIFDTRLTFHDHIVSLAKESFRRLGFVLRSCREFTNHQVIRLLYNTLVRSKLDSSSCVWNPYEKSYTLMIEKVQKAFLRYFYKRRFGYYPYLYPTKFLLGCLGFTSLQVRRAFDQLVTACKIIHGTIDSPSLHEELCKIFVPDNYCRARRHKLFVVPRCRTVARRISHSTNVNLTQRSP